MAKLRRALRKSIVKQLNSLANHFGYEVKRKLPIFYLHQYSSYEEYKEIQIRLNHAKLKHVWADEETLNVVADRITNEFGTATLFGLCHGSRNGFEQNYLASKLNSEILGTDISDTADRFPRSVLWDFHKMNPGWVGKCDFIYSNSHDQSWNPRLALSTWLEQLKIGGLLFLEHSRQHSPEGASAGDPFGIQTEYFPFVLCDWFGHAIAIEIIHTRKGSTTTWHENVGMETVLFILKKMR